MSVNGTVVGPATLDYESPGLLHVPASKVYRKSAGRAAQPGLLGLDPDPDRGTAWRDALRHAPSGSTDRGMPDRRRQPHRGRAKVYVDVPGYISVPQGDVSINTAPGMTCEQEALVRWWHPHRRPSASRRTSRHRCSSGCSTRSSRRRSRSSARRSGPARRVTATALVKVNQTGGYAINSWVTSFG